MTLLLRSMSNSQKVHISLLVRNLSPPIKDGPTCTIELDPAGLHDPGIFSVGFHRLLDPPGIFGLGEDLSEKMGEAHPASPELLNGLTTNGVQNGQRTWGILNATVLGPTAIKQR